MKSRILLVLSLVCVAAGLIVLLAVPALATSYHGATIQKETTLQDDDLTVVAEITVTNADDYGDSLTVTLVDDTIYHASGPVVCHLLESPNTVILLAKGDSYTWTNTYQIQAGDPKPLSDKAHVEGIDDGLVPPINTFILEYPAQTDFPLPEATAGALFGVGVLCLGGFVWLRRNKQSTAKV